MNPKRPRIRDDRYLDWVRKQPCCLCGADRCDAAHVRSGSKEHGKPSTGMGEKPSDSWAVPLCRSCHGTQHNSNELKFWYDRGMDPFELAISYYARAAREGHSSPGSKKPRPRKIASAKGFPRGRKLESRGWK